MRNDLELGGEWMAGSGWRGVDGGGGWGGGGIEVGLQWVWRGVEGGGGDEEVWSKGVRVEETGRVWKRGVGGGYGKEGE